LVDNIIGERDILRLISGISVQDIFSQQPALSKTKEFPRCLNRLVQTTKSDEQICLVLERAAGIDLVTFNRLVQPKLKWEADLNVFEHSADLEMFLKHIAI